MSPNYLLNASSLQFRDIFDAALIEYSRKTGKDIDTDPLTAKLRSCSSSSEVHELLHELAQDFDKFRNGGRKEQLMKRLKPTVDILLILSNGGGLNNGIGIVSASV
jgi:hypothetical protein